MHDPNTLAFRFRFPCEIEIWHVDPCIGGDDDSSGWSGPKLTDTHHQRALAIAGQLRFFLPPPSYDFIWSAVEIIRSVWGYVKYAEFKTHAITAKEMERVWLLASNPVDNLRTNAKGAMVGPDENLERFVRVVYSNFLRFHRPWYRHPRWHFWRWRVEIPALHIRFGRGWGDVDMDW